MTSTENATSAITESFDKGRTEARRHIANNIVLTARNQVVARIHAATKIGNEDLADWNAGYLWGTTVYGAR